MFRNFRSIVVATLVLALPGCGGKVEKNSSLEPGWCAIDDPAFAKPGAQCAQPASAQTYPEEIVLPMPCGRAMAFRKVSFKADNVLADEPAYFGGSFDAAADPADAAMSGPWRGAIGGSFATPAGGGAWESFYYIGKYEVTEPQYAVFASGAFDAPGKCGEAKKTLKDVGNGKVAPAVNVTLAEANAFADSFTRWLLRADAAALKSGRSQSMSLPWQESAPGFLRLPTEAEWEFAARGGAAPAALQASPVYEVFENGGARTPRLEEIAFIAGPQSEPAAGKRVFYVGRKLPNRLGLYDMVGNADELVVDSFRPIRPDAIAGRHGGAVVRGGSADDPPNVVGVGRRREVEIYKADGPSRSPVTGLRLVIAAPIFVNKRGPNYEPLAGNPAFDEDLKRTLRAFGAYTGDAAGAARSEALAEIDRIKRSGGAAGEQLGVLEASLKRANAEAAAQDQATSEKLFEGTVLSAVNIRYVRYIAEYAEKNLAKIESQGIDGDPAEVRRTIADIRTNIQARRTDERANFEYYIENVSTLAKLSEAEVSVIAAVVRDRLGRRGLQRPTKQIDSVLAHIAEVRANGGVVPSNAFEKWRSAFD